MDENFHKQNIEDAHKFNYTETTSGWTEVFMPKCKLILDNIDVKCHDHRLREENGKYWLGVYDGIKMILSIKDLIYKNKNIAVNELRKKGIEVTAL